MSDDDLDLTVRRRFDEVDDVTPPETWARASTLEPAHDVTNRAPWRMLLYAAAAVAVIAGLVFATDREGGEQSAPADSVDATPYLPGTADAVESYPSITTSTTTTIVPGAIVVSTTEIVPSTTTTTTDPGPLAMSSAYQVASGMALTITPPLSVVRICGDIVDVIDVYGVQVGQVLGDDQWVEAAPGGIVTWPPCDGGSSSAPRTIVVPDLPTGPYQACISPDRGPRSCVEFYIDPAVDDAGHVSIVPTSTTFAPSLETAAPGYPPPSGV